MTTRKLTAALISKLRPLRSALFPAACRFAPSCSRYAEEAVLGFGLRAVPLILARLLRCHPLHPGGYDPVPGPLNG